MRHRSVSLLLCCSVAACSGKLSGSKLTASEPATVASTGIDIGPQGGVVASADGTAAVRVPAGALNQTVNFVVAVRDPAGLPAASRIVGQVYDMRPNGQKFLAPVTVRLPAPGGLTAGTRVAYLDAGGVWQHLVNTTLQGTTAVAQVDHFTLFAVVQQEPNGANCLSQVNPAAFCSPQVCDPVQNRCSGPTNASQPNVAYTVGGILSGQSGPVVLQNNGGETLSLPVGAQGFTFPTALPSASAYQVSVLAGPPQQNCVVTNATGVVGSAAVTNVAVVCSNRPYGLSGSLVNLQGPLVLKNNGGDALTLSSQQTQFQFATAVLPGQNFAVTVAVQPPRQLCTVQGGAGQMAVGGVASVRVSCANLYTLSGRLVGSTGPSTLRLVPSGSQTQVEDLNLTQDGNFTFTTALQAGDTYSVGVTAVPSGEVCRLSKGAGTILGNTATLVATCGIPYYLSIDASNLTGSNRLVVTDGQPENINGLTAFTRTSQGQQTFTHTYLSGDPYSLSFMTYPTSQSCFVDGDLGTFSGANVVLHANCNPAVTAAFGQASYTANTDGALSTPTPSSMSAPGGNLAIYGGHVWVADSNQSRVLGFNLPANGFVPASFAVGAADLTSRGSLVRPTAAAADANQLLVADAGASAIKVYRPLPVATTPAASLTLTNLGGTVACSSLLPASVSLNSGVFTVADGANHRVLVYPSGVPNADGTPPSVTLGAVNAQLCAATPPATPTASSLNGPRDSWSNGTILVVADTGNNRVLIWNSMPTSNGQPATVVLGQQTLSGNLPQSGSTGLNAPTSVTSDGSQLLVADTGNNRILQWYFLSGLVSGQPADMVWGQQDFVANSCNGPRGGNTSGPGPNAASADASSLCAPQGVNYFNGHLWISDTGNNRVIAH